MLAATDRGASTITAGTYRGTLIATTVATVMAAVRANHPIARRHIFASAKPNPGTHRLAQTVSTPLPRTLVGGGCVVGKAGALSIDGILRFTGGDGAFELVDDLRVHLLARHVLERPPVPPRRHER